MTDKPIKNAMAVIGGQRYRIASLEPVRPEGATKTGYEAILKKGGKKFAALWVPERGWDDKVTPLEGRVSAAKKPDPVKDKLKEIRDAVKASAAAHGKILGSPVEPNVNDMGKKARGYTWVKHWLNDTTNRIAYYYLFQVDSGGRVQEMFSEIRQMDSGSIDMWSTLIKGQKNRIKFSYESVDVPAVLAKPEALFPGAKGELKKMGLLSSMTLSAKLQGSAKLRAKFLNIVKAASKEAIQELEKRHLEDDLKLDKTHGGGYAPSAEVLAARERSRQKMEVDTLGKKLWGDQFASEHDGDKGVWVTYKDNSDKRIWQAQMDMFADLLKDLGLKLKGNIVSYDQKRVKASMDAHKAYIQLLAKKGSKGAQKMLKDGEVKASVVKAMSEEEIVRQMARAGFGSINSYKSGFKKQLKVIMDYLVSIGVAEFGGIWRGKYNMVDRQGDLDKVLDLAVKGWKQGKFKIDFSKVSVKASTAVKAGMPPSAQTDAAGLKRLFTTTKPGEVVTFYYRKGNSRSSPLSARSLVVKGADGSGKRLYLDLGRKSPLTRAGDGPVLHLDGDRVHFQSSMAARMVPVEGVSKGKAPMVQDKEPTMPPAMANVAKAAAEKGKLAEDIEVYDYYASAPDSASWKMKLKKGTEVKLEKRNKGLAVIFKDPGGGTKAKTLVALSKKKPKLSGSVSAAKDTGDAKKDKSRKSALSDLLAKATAMSEAVNMEGFPEVKKACDAVASLAELEAELNETSIKLRAAKPNTEEAAQFQGRLDELRRNVDAMMAPLAATMASMEAMVLATAALEEQFNAVTEEVAAMEEKLKADKARLSTIAKAVETTAKIK